MIAMRGTCAFRHNSSAFCHQVEKRVHGRQRLLLAQFLIVAFKRPFDELADRLAGALGQIMGQIACLGTAHEQLLFGHRLFLIALR